MVVTVSGCSKYVGRVGALAVALGVGAAVATGHGLGLPQAHAETGSDPSDTKSSDSPSDSASTSTSTGQPSEVHQAATEQPAETSTSSTTQTNQPAAPTTSTGSTSQPAYAAESAPEMHFSSSGGANTSTNDAGQATDADPTPASTSSPTSSPSSTHEQAEPSTTPTVTAPETPVVTTPAAEVTEQPPAVPATTPTAEPTAASNPMPVVPESVHDVITPAGSDGGSDPSQTAGSIPTPPKPGDHVQSVQSTTPDAETTSPLDGQESPTANSMRFAALSLPQPPPDLSQQVNPLLAIPLAIVNIAATFVAAIFAPFLAPGPCAPAQPPLLWAVLAWVRREIQHTFFNRTPHVSSQDVDLSLGPGEVSDPISFDAYDSDGDGIVYQVPDRGALNGPAHGTVTVDQATGTFTYDPDDGYTGTDEFTVTVSDAENCFHFHGLLGFLRPNFGHTDTATIRLTVTGSGSGPGAAPVAFDDTVNAIEDHSATGNVLSNDGHVGATPLSATSGTLNATLGTGPTHGTLAFNSDGSFTYTPQANYSGADSFTYTASDGTATSNLATVTIGLTAVNDAPVVGDDAVTTSEDHQVSGNVLTNDTDVDSGSLAVVNPGAITTTHGTVTLAADGSFTYTPQSNFVGTDLFSYQTTDGQAVSRLAIVTITITAVNDAPVASDDAANTTEDHPVSGNVLTNDTDIDSGTLTVVNPGTITTTHGAVTLAADGSFTYTPTANYSGTDSFSYRATDGQAVSDLATVTITVTAVNDAPVAGDDAVASTEDHSVSGNVLTNDTDVDSGTLTVINPGIITTTHGTVTLAADGSFTYTPQSNFVGTDLFSYQSTDGQAISRLAIVSITVSAVNDAPVAGDDAVNTTEDNPVSGNVLTNDTDVDNPTLTVVNPGTITTTHGTVSLAADGSFTYTPTANYSGTDSFSYTATDGLAVSAPATVTITITAVNDAPVSVDDTASTTEDHPVSGNVLTNDTDVDSGTLTVVSPGTITTTNGTVTLAADGSFTYTPTANFFGTDSFSYRATDGTTVSDLATVTITITAVNDAPVANDDNFTTGEDGVLTVGAAAGVLGNDTDVDSGTLTVVNPGTITT
ncbi:MAG: hypothetical protein JWR34_752, partial [Mycobacterium sp.]|nr:hypothetical protein [Mycobacterium sp.]